MAVDVGPPGHPELMAKAKKLVATLLSDPFLSDLPGDVTAEEVSSIVGVEEGRAITVCVRRFDQQIIREHYNTTSTKLLMARGTHVSTV